MDDKIIAPDCLASLEGLLKAPADPLTETMGLALEALCVMRAAETRWLDLADELRECQDFFRNKHGKGLGG